MVPCRGQCYTSSRRMSPKAHTFFLHAVLFILMSVLQVPSATSTSLKGQMAVFDDNITNEYGTLSAETKIPSLEAFTLCVDIRIRGNIRNGMAVFTYNTDSRPSGPPSSHELGIIVKENKLEILMFQQNIDVKERLLSDNWHSLCLTWNSQSEEAHIYVNKTLVESKNLNNQRLGGDGSLVLGHKHMRQDNQLQGNFQLAFVGDMYLFRLWDFEKNQQVISELNCEDGNVITWDSKQWNFIGVSLERDTTLNCCEQFVKSRFKRSEYEHHRARISRRLLDLNSTDSFSTTVLSNNITAAPTTSAITESSTLNKMSSTSHTTESSTFNNVSSLTHTTESSTFNNVSSLTHTTESSTLNEMASTRHSTEMRTLTVTSPPPTVTGNNTMAMASSVQNNTGENASSVTTFSLKMQGTRMPNIVTHPKNPTENSTTGVTTVQMNTTENSTTGVTTVQMNSTESSTTGVITVQMNTTENSTTDVTILQMNTTENSTTDVIILQMNTTENSTTDVIILQMNTTDISTVTSVPLNTTENSTTDVIILQMNTTDISTVTSVPLNTTENSTTGVTTVQMNTTGSNFTSLTTVQLNTTEDSTITSLIPNITENSTINATLISAVGSTVKLNVTESPPTTPVTLNFTDLDETDVAAFVSELDKILQLKSIDAGIASKLIGVISTLLNAPPAVLASFSKRLIQSVDTIGLKLSFTTESINITSSSLALAVSKINTTGFNGADFSISDVTNLQVSLDEAAPGKTFAAIRLPPSLLSNLTLENQERASRVQFTFYEKPTLFQDPSMKNISSLNSYIIASSVANLSIGNLTDPVRITFKNLKPTKNNSKVQCVFWDFSRNNGSGGWNSDGCKKVLKDPNQTVCECEHLTHFGILLDISGAVIDEQNDRILTYITYIGCGLSSVLLAITLVTYLAFEKLRRDYPSKILINLCTALLFLNLTFLIDSWISGFSINGLCIAVAVFLHYFLLVSFTWMSLEAIHMYMALVKVFNTYVRKYMLKFCIIGWGTPSIVIAIILIIKPDNYGLGHYDKTANTTSDMFCWIKNEIVFYVATVAYFCVMFLLNVSMFIVVLIQFCRIKNQKKHQNAERSILQNIRSVTGLTFLLGITWGFAFFAWAPVNLPFMYLFTIFNTLQGAFIFIFHFLIKENVQKQWRRYLCCGKLRLAENSDWSRTVTNNTKKLQTLVQAKSLSSTFNNSLQYHSSLFLVQEYSNQPNDNGAKS